MSEDVSSKVKKIVADHLGPFAEISLSFSKVK